jgi:hypothetical protein
MDVQRHVDGKVCRVRQQIEDLVGPTFAEIAPELGLSLATLKRYAKRGMPFGRLGGRST